MRMMKAFLLLLALPAAVMSAERAETVAITGGRVVTLGPAGTIDGGTVLIQDGKVRAVGRDVAIPSGARRIDATGKVVTPGFMDSLARLGLVEVAAVEETVDTRTQNDQITAAFNVADAINPRSILIKTNRVEGLTRAVIAPAPGSSLIAGQGVVIHLGGPEDFLLRSPVAMYGVLGANGRNFGGGSRAAALLRLREILHDAREYAKNRSAYEQGETRDLAVSRLDLEALQPVVRGELPLVLAVNRASDIQAALRLAKEEKLKLILAGAGEGWVVADEIAAAKVPVLITPLNNLPGSFDVLGATLENAARLHKAGVTFAFMSVAAHEAYSIRQQAGNAVAYGLPWDAAMAALTTVPARLWGIGDRYGSLEPGKDADVVVWTGDPLEVVSYPTEVFIRGTQVPIESRQLELRDRYKDVGSSVPPAYRNP
ncbi:MAG TPA: amidohydrolase family protein [Thermoanaerobaculia bacterium]|nr:amidohydrolase family protein [Thermoanaerobaculia bacterium]